MIQRLMHPMYLLLGAFFVTLALILSGCDAQEARAPRRAVAPSSEELAVRRFPARDIVFNDTQFFMWKEGASRAHRARVLDNVAKLEDSKDYVFEKTGHQKGLKKRMDAAILAAQEPSAAKAAELGAKLEVLNGHLAAAQETLGKVTAGNPGAGHVIETQIADLQAEILDVTDELAPYAGVETLISLELTGYLDAEIAQPEKEAELAAKREDLKKATSEAQVKKLTRDIARLEKKVSEVRYARAALKMLGLEASYGEWKSLGEQIKARQDEVQQRLDAVNEDVFVFNSSPIRFKFAFAEDHTIRAGIENWDLSRIDDPAIREENAPKDFSTELFSIRRVRYSSLGGAFTFEVYTPAAVYWFKLAAAKYDATDGRTHYKADVIRCSVADGFGLPTLVYDRDVVRCGVDVDGLFVPVTRGTRGLRSEQVGRPLLRRGAASMVDKDKDENS